MAVRLYVLNRLPVLGPAFTLSSGSCGQLLMSTSFGQLCTALYHLRRAAEHRARLNRNCLNLCLHWCIPQNCGTFLESKVPYWLYLLLAYSNISSFERLRRLFGGGKVLYRGLVLCLIRSCTSPVSRSAISRGMYRMISSSSSLDACAEPTGVERVHSSTNSCRLKRSRLLIVSSSDIV